MKQNTPDTIILLIQELKIHALSAGKYPPPFTNDAYDGRDKSKAFRSISYNRCVRQINALLDILHAAHSSKISLLNKN